MHAALILYPACLHYTSTSFVFATWGWRDSLGHPHFYGRCILTTSISSVFTVGFGTSDLADRTRNRAGNDNPWFGTRTAQLSLIFYVTFTEYLNIWLHLLNIYDEVILDKLSNCTAEYRPHVLFSIHVHKVCHNKPLCIFLDSHIIFRLRTLSKVVIYDCYTWIHPCNRF